MYLKLTCKIAIGGKYILRGVNEIEVKKSVHQIIQSCKVTLPLSVVMRNQDMLERAKIVDKIKEGDSIRVEFGYNGNNRLEFEGYIRRINYKSPVVLECEDELYLFRKTLYHKSFRKCSLKELITFLLDGLNDRTGFNVEMYDKMPDMSFSNFVMKEANGVQVLQELKDKYGLNNFLTTINGKKTLYVGLAYTLTKNRVKYVIDRNVIDASNLTYQSNSDKTYKVKVTNFKRNGSKVSFETGDKNGELRTLNFYGDYDKKELEQMAKAEMERFSTASYKGNFETFLIPYCEPGTIGEINNRQFPERKGTHYVGTVTTIFGTGGGRRKPEIDIKVST